MNREIKLDTHEDSPLGEAAHKFGFEINGHKWSNNNNEMADNMSSFMSGAQWGYEYASIQVAAKVADKDKQIDNLKVQLEMTEDIVSDWDDIAYHWMKKAEKYRKKVKKLLKKVKKLKN